ncbi:MAG: DNA alkylation repair protein [Promethearchaeota archaeon]
MTNINKNEIQKQLNKLFEIIDAPKEFITELHKFLQRYADNDLSDKYRRIIPEMGKAFGTPKPILVKIATKLGNYGQKNPDLIFPFLKTLWKNGSFEERDIVGKTIEKLGKKFADECLNLIPDFLPDLDNWSVCDVLGSMGMRPIVISKTEEVLSLCEKCMKDEGKWIRRFGVVTLWTFKKIPAPPNVFEILNIVMDDGDKDVKKGVAWILRQMTNMNSNKVTIFLLEKAKANPSKHARWIIKNGMKKIPQEKQDEILSLLEK